MYEIFEEVPDDGQESIESWWIVMKKEMWADSLTKEMEAPANLKLVMTRGECRLGS